MVITVNTFTFKHKWKCKEICRRNDFLVFSDCPGMKFVLKTEMHQI